MSKVRILVVDDEKLIRWSLERRLSTAGYAVLTAESGEEALEIVRENPPDLVLLDIHLPGRDGTDILLDLREAAPDAQVIMITASDSIETAIQSFKDGAEDYITKPFDFAKLEITVRKAAENQRMRQQQSLHTSAQQRRYDTSRIVGESKVVEELREVTERIARSDATTVLLTGESGTGKDLIARVIHYRSPRSDRPFMAINCTAIAETLLESELMGHEKGAFTDAKAMKKGLFELGDGGTVFLDEIGDMPRSLQVKLLRTIEDKTIRRVGGTETIRVDIRIIAATNRDLDEAVRVGDFRDDLYYRLKVFPLHLPPLRDRREDVPGLVKSFVESFNRQYGRNVSVSSHAMKLLCQHTWPGNVRELRNVLERAIILQTDGEIGAEDLPVELRRGSDPGPTPTSGGFLLPQEGISLEFVERDLIRQALERTDHNQTRSAQLLNLTRDALRYRMKKYGLN
jgi:DNA-binding NtrC family response regulator